MGDDLVALSNDLRALLTLMTGRIVDSRRSSVKRDAKRKEWTQESVVQAATTATKCIGQVLQGFLHHFTVHGLVSDDETSGNVVAASTPLGKLFVNVLDALNRAKGRMNDLKSRLDSKSCIVESKEEEIATLKAVLSQKPGSSLATGPPMRLLHTVREKVSEESSPTLPPTPKPTSQPDITSKEEVDSKDVPSGRRTVLSQTLETSFQSCLVCTDTCRCLLEIRDAVGEMSGRCGLTSSQKSKWLTKTMLSSKGVSKWTSECKADLSRVDRFIQGVLDQQGDLKERLCAREESLGRLSSQMDVLRGQIRDLETSIREIEERHRDQLATLKDTFAGKEAELKSVSGLLESQLDDVRREAGILEKKLEERKSICMELESEVSSLRKEVETKERVFEEKMVLERDLMSVQEELDSARLTLNKQTSELDQSQAKMASLDQQVELLQQKQSDLLGQVGQLEDNCTNLGAEFAKSQSCLESVSRELTAVKLDRDNVKKEVNGLQKTVSELEAKEESLQARVDQFVTDIEKLQTEIEEEKEKQTLLMDYPTPSGVKGKRDDDLSGVHAERQMAANAVRISLLEEYSAQLRRRSMPETGSLNKVSLPVPLWRPKCLANIRGKSADSSSRRSPSPPLLLQPSPSPVPAYLCPFDRQVAGSGRAAATGIRKGSLRGGTSTPTLLNKTALPRWSSLDHDREGTVSRGGTAKNRDALALMQRARKLARTIASAEVRSRKDDVITHT